MSEESKNERLEACAEALVVGGAWFVAETPSDLADRFAATLKAHGAFSTSRAVGVTEPDRQEAFRELVNAADEVRATGDMIASSDPEMVAMRLNTLAERVVRYGTRLALAALASPARPPGRQTELWGTVRPLSSDLASRVAFYYRVPRDGEINARLTLFGSIAGLGLFSEPDRADLTTDAPEEPR